MLSAHLRLARRAIYILEASKTKPSARTHPCRQEAKRRKFRSQRHRFCHGVAVCRAGRRGAVICGIRKQLHKGRAWNEFSVLLSRRQSACFMSPGILMRLPKRVVTGNCRSAGRIRQLTFAAAGFCDGSSPDFSANQATVAPHSLGFFPANSTRERHPAAFQLAEENAASLSSYDG
jgi:hypothetical protein